jgi:hypothetical protein
MEDVDIWPTLCKTFFNPYFFGEAHFHDDEDVKKTINHMLQKNMNISTTYAQAWKDFANFVENQKPSSTPPPPPMSNLHFFPYEWFDLIGTSGCTLAPIAHHILVQLCSISLCEQN